MALSQRKLARIEQDRRRNQINARSINGTGRFMDAYADADAKEYLLTGDESILQRLPDYRNTRRPRNA